MKYLNPFVWTLVVGVGLHLISCTPDKEQTQATVVEGSVYDTNKQQPVVNATVYLQAYTIQATPTNSNHTVYENIIDSVKTDVAGNYAISLPGTALKQTPNLLARLNNARFKMPDTQRQMVNKGQKNTLNFATIELHPVKLRVIVKDNPRPPLTVQIPLAHEKQAIIYGLNADTTITLAVIPNKVNSIDFSIVHPIRNNNVKSHFDTINARGFKPVYQSTQTVYPATFFWESK